MGERTVILRLDDETQKTLTVATSFSSEELDKAAEVISDQMFDEENYDADRVVKALEQKGYIRIIGPAPEIIDIMI